MSHIVTVKTEISDIAALKAACKPLGLTFCEGQRTATFWDGLRQPCEHAIKVPGTTWEIAVMHNAKTGTFKLGADFECADGATIAKVAGKGLCRLTQEYAVQKATAEVRRNGWSIQRTVQTDGTVVLNCSGM